MSSCSCRRQHRRASFPIHHSLAFSCRSFFFFFCCYSCSFPSIMSASESFARANELFVEEAFDSAAPHYDVSACITMLWVWLVLILEFVLVFVCSVVFPFDKAAIIELLLHGLVLLLLLPTTTNTSHNIIQHNTRTQQHNNLTRNTTHDNNGEREREREREPPHSHTISDRTTRRTTTTTTTTTKPQSGTRTRTNHLGMACETRVRSHVSAFGETVPPSADPPRFQVHSRQTAAVMS